VGYDDEPDRYYGWDSTVPNHGGPAVGAICALRDSMTRWVSLASLVSKAST
jgi:hypothetical protein